MPSTRSSARNASGAGSSPASKDNQADSAGTKRKTEAGSSPAQKRGRKAKDQKTLEETLPTDNGNKDGPNDEDMKDAAEAAEKQNGDDKAKTGGEDENDGKCIILPNRRGSSVTRRFRFPYRY